MRKVNPIDNRIGDFAVDIENLIGHFFGDQKSNGQRDRDWIPHARIIESDTAYRVTLELPGVAGDDVSIEMHDGSLQVSGTRKPLEITEDAKLLKTEFRTGRFDRSFKFPVQIEPDDVRARFENGLLQIVLPKSAKSLPRKIEIS